MINLSTYVPIDLPIRTALALTMTPNDWTTDRPTDHQSTKHTANSTRDTYTQTHTQPQTQRRCLYNCLFPFCFIQTGRKEKAKKERWHGWPPPPPRGCTEDIVHYNYPTTVGLLLQPRSIYHWHNLTASLRCRWLYNVRDPPRRSIVAIHHPNRISENRRTSQPNEIWSRS